HLLTHLGPDDAVGLVTFAEDARVVVAPDATAQGAFAEALGAVRAGGPTNLAAGLEAGVAAARVLAASWSEDDRPFEIRVLIVSDGLANVGVTSPDAIAAVASDLPSGVRVSAIGLGAD